MHELPDSRLPTWSYKRLQYRGRVDGRPLHKPIQTDDAAISHF